MDLFYRSSFFFSWNILWCTGYLFRNPSLWTRWIFGINSMPRGSQTFQEADEPTWRCLKNHSIGALTQSIKDAWEYQCIFYHFQEPIHEAYLFTAVGSCSFFLWRFLIHGSLESFFGTSRETLSWIYALIPRQIFGYWLSIPKIFSRWTIHLQSITNFTWDSPLIDMRSDSWKELSGDISVGSCVKLLLDDPTFFSFTKIGMVFCWVYSWISNEMKIVTRALMISSNKDVRASTSWPTTWLNVCF